MGINKGEMYRSQINKKNENDLNTDKIIGYILYRKPKRLGDNIKIKNKLKTRNRERCENTQIG